jgi:hypothetical protein
MKGIRCTGYARWDAAMLFGDNLTNYFSVPLLGMVVLSTCMNICDLQEGYQRTVLPNNRRGIFGKRFLFRLLRREWLAAWPCVTSLGGVVALVER